MPDLDDLVATLLSPGDDGELPFASQVAVISSGSPCTCGPGFCWHEEGCGGFGYGCRPDKNAERPELSDCPHCGAKHQGTHTDGRALCWNCCEYHEAPFRLPKNGGNYS